MKKTVRVKEDALKSLFISTETARRITKKFEREQDARQSLRSELAWGIVGRYGLYLWTIRYTKKEAIQSIVENFHTAWEKIMSDGGCAQKTLITYDDGRGRKK